MMKGIALPVALCVVLAMFTSYAYALAPTDILFPYAWEGDINQVELEEPSGIVYHATRGTLFAVGDEGDLCEIKTDGTPIKMARLRSEWPHSDFEGVTYDPASGLVYIAVEGVDQILEVNPDTFEILREFDVQREFEGVTYLDPEGDGIEAIEFVPDADHPEGGSFYVTNQSWALPPAKDPSVLLEVVAPLRSGEGPAIIRRVMAPGIVDMAALHYEQHTGRLLVISDSSNALFEMTLDGALTRGWVFPGNSQEGITVDGDGFVYVAQDLGDIQKLKWLRPQEETSP
ncbi:MAG: SdiA-regulated domain-containing protein [Armatimonadetes bacterium]|nr:SdiA-regulated domain-containing protein [Armatimonadota bacterium]